LLYFLANDESMPEATRTEWSKWGFPKDEFVDNDHFPRAMYVRDGRRMVRDDIMITMHNSEYDYPDTVVDDPILINLWPIVRSSITATTNQRNVADCETSTGCALHATNYPRW
jgi:hypothetical protein